MPAAPSSPGSPRAEQPVPPAGGGGADTAGGRSADDVALGRARAGGAGRGSPRRWRRRLLEWVAILLAALVAALLLRAYVVQAFYVPSGSMLPTLQIGDRILVEKVDLDIHRGDIIVFRRPPGDLYLEDGATDLVKRVIGLPGETIWSEGNTVYIDGRPLPEPWLPPHTPLGPPIRRQVIPKGEYFVMGDNRADSYDSRYWGPIPKSLIIGKVFLLIWRHGHPAFHIF